MNQTGESMIRVLIADDHPIVCKGFMLILEEEPDIVVVGEAGTTDEVLRLVGESRCNVVLLDLGMPGAGGLEVIREIRHSKNPPAVLVISVHPEERYGLRALKTGASGYLTKESAPELLIEAIRKVHAGGRFITPSLAELMADDLGKEGETEPHESLSDREFQVLRMVAQGLTVSAIAEQLGLSVKTVSTYRARLLRKMQLKNNAELTHYSIRKGLVD